MSEREGRRCKNRIREGVEREREGERLEKSTRLNLRMEEGANSQGM